MSTPMRAALEVENMQKSPAERPWLPAPTRMNITMPDLLDERGKIVSKAVIADVYVFEQSTVDVAKLRVAVDETVRSQDVLQSRFRYDPVAGVEYQLVEQLDSVLKIEERPGADRDEVARRAREIAAQESETPFDFVSGYMLRATCVTGHEVFAVVVAVDHAVCDGSSYAMLLRSIERVYRDGPAENLGSVGRTSLAQVAAEEATFLAGARGQKAIERWRDRLPNGIPEMALNHAQPWDCRPLPGGVAHVKAETADYEAHLSDARDLRVTPFALACAKLLDAMRPDVVSETFSYISPMPSRWVPSARSVVGYFSGPLPVVLAAPGANLRETAMQVRDALGFTIAHQSIPFAQLALLTTPSGEPVETQGNRRRTIFITGIDASPLEMEGSLAFPDEGTHTEKDTLYDLSVWVADSGSSLTVYALYRKGWIASTQVDRWIGAIRDSRL